MLVCFLLRAFRLLDGRDSLTCFGNLGSIDAGDVQRIMENGCGSNFQEGSETCQSSGGCRCMHLYVVVDVNADVAWQVWIDTDKILRPLKVSKKVLEMCQYGISCTSDAASKHWMCEDIMRNAIIGMRGRFPGHIHAKASNQCRRECQALVCRCR